MRSVLLAIVIGALGLGGVVASASEDGSPARARATALVAGGSIGPQVEASASGTDSAGRSGGVQVDGLTIREGESSARTETGGEPSARSVAVARSIEALDGLVTAYGARRELTARPDGKAFDGRVQGLRIDGEMIGDVSEPRRFYLPDEAGTVDVNKGDAAIRIVLDKAAGGQPAWTELRVAVVRGGARSARRPEADPEPTATPRDEEDAEASRRSGRRSKREKGKRSVPAPDRLTRGGFAFPVYAERPSVADDFGGPRQIGPHQGNDIFAPFGSPVLAVADGTLRKVGTLPISGNRLWLVTDEGDAFFYAHLASFSELAETGRQVEAGDVLGFVGNTGDAEPTPPHVHFEIHPRGIDGPAADPHEVLLAWERKQDVQPSAWLRRVGTDTTERPGALVEVRDFIAGE